jgi:succinoglycan biosynthesis protein ExoA
MEERAPSDSRPSAAGRAQRADMVTVVVPARDEERSIARCLDSILAQTYGELQVVVVDGASADRTAEIVGRYVERDGRVELLENPFSTIPTSLNAALGVARGRWLVRVDAHATVPPDYVERCVRLLRTGRWGGVGGRKDAVGRTAAGAAVAAAMRSPFGVGNSLYHHGTAPRTVEHVPFGAYPVALLRERGGWDERLTANEDFELDHRIRRGGSQLLFDPQLRIDWECRQSIGELFAQYRRYGRGKADVALLHPRSMRPRHVLPPLFTGAVACLALVAPKRPRLLASALVPYAVAVAVVSASAGRSLEHGSRRYLPAAFVAMHVGWGVGFWEGLARRAVRAR